MSDIDRTTAVWPEARPIPAWPGTFLSLGPQQGEVYLRSAPARSDRHGDPEPALLVHGFAGASTNWTDLMALLSRPDPAVAGERTGYPLACDAVDLPGFGLSPPAPDDRYSVDALADTVARVIERRGRGPVHLIGNSLGGAVCTRLAATRPAFVRTLTLISPALPDLWPRLAMLRFPPLCIPGLGPWLLRRARMVPAATRVDLTLASVYYDPGRVHPDRRAEEIAELERRDRLDYDAAVLLACARSIVAEYLRRGGDSLWRDAARVTAPTLVVYGSHDRLVDPRMAGRAARVFHDARVVVLPRTGHVAQMERPVEVATEIRRLLASAPHTVGECRAGVDR